MKTKLCSCCSVELPVASFAKDKSRKDGYYFYCRLCCSKKTGRKTRLTISGVTLTEAQAAYIAGLIDGEGCICIHTTKSRHSYGIQYNLIITITMAGAFLEELHKEVGIGYFRAKSNRNTKPAHWKYMNVWRWNQADARCLLPQVRPYLRHKTKQADLALQFLALDWKHTTARKAELHKQCQELNRRGMAVELTT